MVHKELPKDHMSNWVNMATFGTRGAEVEVMVPQTEVTP